MLVGSPARERATSFGTASGEVEQEWVLRGPHLGDDVHGSSFGKTRRTRRRQCRLEAPFGEPRPPSGASEPRRTRWAGTSTRASHEASGSLESTAWRAGDERTERGCFFGSGASSEARLLRRLMRDRSLGSGCKTGFGLWSRRSEKGRAAVLQERRLHPRSTCWKHGGLAATASASAGGAHRDSSAASPGEEQRWTRRDSTRVPTPISVGGAARRPRSSG